MFESLRKSMKALSRELSALFEVPDATEQPAVTSRRPAAPARAQPATPAPDRSSPGIQLPLPLEFAPGIAAAPEPRVLEPEAIAPVVPIALPRRSLPRSTEGQLLGVLEGELGELDFLAASEGADVWEPLARELEAVSEPARNGAENGAAEAETLWHALSAELSHRQLPLQTGDLSTALEWELSALGAEPEEN